MANIRLYLDTNVFVRAFEGTDDVSAALRRLLGRTHVGKAFLVTSQLTLAEAIQKPYADGNDTLVETYKNWLIEGTNTLTIGQIRVDVLYYSAVLRNHYKSMRLPDAIHASTAFAMEATHLVTADKGFPASLQLVHTRYGWSRASAEIAVVAPTPDFLRTIEEAVAS